MVAVPASRPVSPVALGLGLTIASAVFFSWLGVLTQLAYAEGATVGTVLSGRFLVAAAVLWPLVWVARSRRPDRRQVLAGIVLGLGYSAHAWLFSESLARLDAGLVDLVLFTYPALVLLGAVALRRERLNGRRLLALGTAAGGTVLVLIGGLGAIDPLGAALALGAAVAYAAYILSSAGELQRTDPLVLTALVATSAAGVLTVAGLAQNDVSPGIGAPALAFIAAAGLVAVGGMTTFIAGIRGLGPARASIVSAVQPALTPLIGFAVFADRLGPAQVVGGALVVSAVVVLEGGAASTRSRSWLSWLPRGERRLLVRASSAVDFPAGRRILWQGAPAGGFFLIERGRARVLHDDRGLAELGPGDFFGEIALLRGGARTASVVADTDVRIRIVPRPDFERALQMLPTLARAVRRASVERSLASRPLLATA